MKRRLGGALLFVGLFTVLAQAEESVVFDQAAIVRCQQVIFNPPEFVEMIRPAIMQAVPPERHPFWNDLLPAITSSLSQRHDEARAGFARLLAEYPRSVIGDCNHVFLLRLHGVVLGKAGDYSASIRVYDDLLRQYGDNPDPDIRRQAAYAMNHRAVTLGTAGDFEGKIQALDALINAFKNTADADTRNVMIASWIMKGTAYLVEGYSDEADQTFQEIKQAFSGTVPMREMIAMASKLGLVNGNRNHEPIDTLPKAVTSQPARPRPAPSPEEAEAGSIMLKAMQLNRQDDPQAITLYDEVIARHRDSENGKLQNKVAHAMVGKAGLLERLGDAPAADEAYHDFAAWAEAEKATETQGAIAMGMVFKATSLGRAGDWRGAIDGYDKVAGRFKDVDDDAVRMMVADALFMKARTLDELGDAEAAYATVTGLIATYGAHPFPGVRIMAERAEPLRKQLARQLGKAE